MLDLKCKNKQQTIKMYPILIILILLLQISSIVVSGCNRYATYNEPCVDPTVQYSSSSYQPVGYTSGNSYSQCNPYKMLQCERRTGSCQCPDYYNYYWDAYQQTCYIRIGSVCKESFGGLGESWYNHGCPENSMCNPATGYCQCRPLFKTTYDYIGCSSALSIIFSSQKLFYVISFSIGIKFFLC